MADQDVETPGPANTRTTARISLIASIVAMVMIFIGVTGSYLAIIFKKTNEEFHPLQLMSLFYASGVALILITFFRTTDGPVDVDIGPMKFKGAGGPIVMWILAFVAICAGMKMLNLDH